MADNTFSLSLERVQDYEFKVDFGMPGVDPLLTDESEPLGKGQGPNPSRMLGAAVGNCLSASLLFCVQKSRLEVASLKTEVEGALERNEAGRIRIKEFNVTITIDVAGATPERAKRCLELFEDFCTVTASVRRGVPVHVRVLDADGNLLHESD